VSARTDNRTTAQNSYQVGTGNYLLNRIILCRLGDVIELMMNASVDHARMTKTTRCWWLKIKVGDDDDHEDDGDEGETIDS
jgi:hypothetical protein